MTRTEAVNTFTEGMIMDVNPLVTQKNVLVNALNATLVTMNGNENVLQNDMGNGRVETAYLPEGYIPLGTAELGGIIYIVSYNPITDKCQIGSFPSPERNVSSSSTGLSNQQIVSSNFLSNKKEINSTLVKLKLSDNVLHPGDKYIVCSDDLANNWKYITDCYYDDKTPANTPRNIKLSIATIDSNGRIIKLSDLKRFTSKSGIQGDYIIADGQITESEQDIDTYRNIVSSEYNVFSSKIAGELYLIAELEVIDKFDITYKCIKYNDNGTYTLRFYIQTSPDGIFIDYIRVQKALQHYYFKRSDSETTSLTFDLDFNISEGSSFNLSIVPCMKYGILSQLQTEIFIDLSLLGTGVIKNNLWKYYKEESSISINWNLSVNPTDTQEVTSVQILAREFQSQEDVVIESLENKLAYSGSITSKINFSDQFKSNTLYFCTIRINIKDTSDGSDTYTEKTIKKCLYTNGVFNQVYIDSPEKTDYDQLTPELTYQVQFTQSDNITGTQTTKVDELCSEQVPSQNFRGMEINSYSGQIQLTPQAGFLNSYGNSFSVDASSINVTVQNSESTIDREVNKVSTNSMFDDTQYMDIQPQVVSELSPTDSIDYLSTHDEYCPNVSQSGSNITIDVKGTIYNKVSADNTQGSISVTNYVTPIVYNDETASKYGLQVSHATNGGHFYMSSEYLSVGISAGGNKSDGTGGTYYCVGTRKIMDTGSNTIGYGSPSMITSDSKSVYLATGNIKEVMQNVNTDLSIIPVLIVGVGFGDAEIKDRTVNNNHFNYYSTSSNRSHLLEGSYISLKGKGGTDRLGVFKETVRELPFLTIQLFMKQQNGSVISIDSYFPIKDVYSTLQVTNTSSMPSGATLGDVIGSLLTQLYVKQGTGSINGYYVNNVQYYSQVSELWKTQINYQLSENGTGNNIVKLNNYTMSQIQSQFQQWNPGSQIYNCLNVQTAFNKNIQKITSNYQVTLQKPEILNQFLTAKNNPIIDTYVITINDQKLDSVESISDYSIYTIQDNKLRKGYSLSTNYVNSITYNPDRDRISVEYSSIKGFNYLNTSNLYWDYRNKLLKLKDSYVEQCYKMDYNLAYRSYASPEKTNSYVLHPDIQIFSNCNVVK